MSECTKCAPELASIPLAAHELALKRADKSNRRLWIALLVSIALFVASNCLWIWHESQFEKIKVTQDAENGQNSFIGNDGDIIYGTSND